MRAAIIGCGLIGRKRADSLSGIVNLVGCFDEIKEVADSFASDNDTRSFSTVKELLLLQDLDFVIIATRHDALHSLVLEALDAGKHVFVEKPGAIDYASLKNVYQVARDRNLKVHVGYNHRFHPAVKKAYELFDDGSIGEIMFMRGHYGHGGRIGYEKEWRADKTKSGGGELIDQGTHLIDLAIGLLGEVKLDYAATPTYFWSMPVEDNAFISLKSESGQIAFLHASCTEWKNGFELQIYGKIGKIEIKGLGRSYGLETLTFHKMLPQMGPPISQTWTFPEDDDSWKTEMAVFLEDLLNGSSHSDNLDSSLHVLEIIQEIYLRTGR